MASGKQDSEQLYLHVNDTTTLLLQEPSDAVCLNDTYIKTTFFDQLLKDQQRSLRLAQQQRVLRRHQKILTNDEHQLADTYQFESYLQDIIKVADSTIFLNVAPHEEYAPVIHPDYTASTRRLFTLHKRWLGFENDGKPGCPYSLEKKDQCEVSPYVSYSGEQLHSIAEKYKDFEGNLLV